MGGLAFAGSSHTYQNATILGGGMGGEGKTPAVEVIRVTIGSEDDTVSPGMVMAWGIEDQYTDGNALGLVVNICDRAMSEDMANNVAGKGPYAGVMITTCTSIDPNATTGEWGGNSNPMSPSEGVGFMAIRGYVDAYMDVSRSSVGDLLVIHGNSAIASGGAAGYFATRGKLKEGTTYPASYDVGVSHDIGVLLEAPGTTDGLRKVWLR